MAKLGLIGDPHACPEPVAEALAIFRRELVDAIWCTGDIAGYGEALADTVSLLMQADCMSILGNHEQWYLEQHRNEHDAVTQGYLSQLPRVTEKEIEGIRLYMVHASPPDALKEGIRLLDQEGVIIESEREAWKQRLRGFEHDVLIVGHTHQVFAERLGEVLVINPGSTRFNHCCATLTLPGLTVQWFALGGQAINKSWNWGYEASS